MPDLPGWSRVCDADPGGPEARNAIHRLAGMFWRPVYAYFRARNLPDAEARKSASEFFAALTGSEFLDAAAQNHSRFRSCIESALSEWDRLRALPRSRPPVPVHLGESFEPPPGSPLQVFHREWTRTIVELALESMEKSYKAAGNEKAFEIFVLRDVQGGDGPDASYDSIAQRFGVRNTDITTYLYRARVKLKELVFEKIRETVSGDADAQQELRELFPEPT